MQKCFEGIFAVLLNMPESIRSACIYRIFHLLGPTNLKVFCFRQFHSKVTEGLQEIFVNHLFVTVSTIILSSLFYVTAGGVGELDITFAKKMIKGTSRIRVSKLDYQLTAKNGRLSLENLFLGRDPAISDLVNQMINANFKQYSDITLPLVSQEMSRVLKRNANKILVKFTEEQLFP